jgi:hypothetical protein
MDRPPSLSSPRLILAPPPADPFWKVPRPRFDFFILGSAKCGTRWLFSYLYAHPETYLPQESNFFTQNRDRAKEYDRIYRQEEIGPRLCGEYSNTYLLDHRLHATLATRNPGAKAILLCRNPVERAFSHYLMDARLKDVNPTTTSFLDCLLDPVTFSYFDFGLYEKHARSILHRFGESNVFIETLDAIFAFPNDVARRVSQFLGIAYRPDIVPVGTVNAWKPQDNDTRPFIPSADATWLAHHYLSANAALGSLIGRDLSAWGGAARRQP